MLAIASPELDNGPRTDRSATMRMCAVCREVRPVDELIRFVLSPEGAVVPDLKRKLPGRVRELAAFLEPELANRASLEEQLAFATTIAPKLTIQGGTTEVLRGIIARGLGLR